MNDEQHPQLKGARGLRSMADRLEQTVFYPTEWPSLEPGEKTVTLPAAQVVEFIARLRRAAARLEDTDMKVCEYSSALVNAGVWIGGDPAKYQDGVWKRLEGGAGHRCDHCGEQRESRGVIVKRGDDMRQLDMCSDCQRAVEAKIRPEEEEKAA
jgi:hypothetical protein